MSIVNFFSNSKKIHPNDKILKVTEEKTQKSLEKNVQVAPKPMLETSLLKGSTIQAVGIFCLTA